MRKLYLLSAAVLVACLSGSVGAEEAQSPSLWPERVLITNDDGIEDEERLLALANAFAGIPALAVSGIDEEDPEAPEKVADWVAHLAAWPPVRELEAGTYLTVALPRVPLDDVAGVRVAHRFHLRRIPILTLAEDEGSEDSELWRITGAEAPEPDSMH